MDEPWRKWWAMALDSLEAARTLEKSGRTRSSISRFYYACYQAATAILLYQGLLPPNDSEGREAWSHVQTPDLLRRTVFTFWTLNERHRLSTDLSRLYGLRLVADYKSKIAVEPTAFLRALKDVSYFVGRVRAALPKDG